MQCGKHIFQMHVHIWNDLNCGIQCRVERRNIYLNGEGIGTENAIPERLFPEKSLVRDANIAKNSGTLRCDYNKLKCLFTHLKLSVDDW
jgi:hypothetical protein